MHAGKRNIERNNQGLAGDCIQPDLLLNTSQMLLPLSYWSPVRVSSRKLGEAHWVVAVMCHIHGL